MRARAASKWQDVGRCPLGGAHAQSPSIRGWISPLPLWSLEETRGEGSEACRITCAWRANAGKRLSGLGGKTPVVVSSARHDSLPPEGFGVCVSSLLFFLDFLIMFCGIGEWDVGLLVGHYWKRTPLRIDWLGQNLRPVV